MFDLPRSRGKSSNEIRFSRSKSKRIEKNFKFQQKIKEKKQRFHLEDFVVDSNWF